MRGKVRVLNSLIVSLSTCRPDTECCFVCTEAELSRRNSEDNVENIPLSKKTVVILKKELAQKTEALNKALKRENELKVSWLYLSYFVLNQDKDCLCAFFKVFYSFGIQISLAELQSLLHELEGRNEGHTANIESLTATLKTKDEIINVGNPPFTESVMQKLDIFFPSAF